LNPRYLNPEDLEILDKKPKSDLDKIKKSQIYHQQIQTGLPEPIPEDNQLAILKYLVEHNCPIKSKVWNLASEVGRIEILDYLYSIKVPDPYFFTINRLEILIWIEKHFGLEQSYVGSAFRQQDVEMLKYLVAARFEIKKDDYRYCKIGIPILQYMAELGIIFDYRFLATHICYNDYEIFRFILNFISNKDRIEHIDHLLGCSLDCLEIYQDLLQYKNLSAEVLNQLGLKAVSHEIILKYLFSIGFHPESIEPYQREIIDSDKLKVLELFIENQVRWSDNFLESIIRIHNHRVRRGLLFGSHYNSKEMFILAYQNGAEMNEETRAEAIELGFLEE
jgi:hypothetical protein